MNTRIKLIGPPEIRDCDGQIRSIRGNKPWALLARVLLAEHPIGKRQLSRELLRLRVELGSRRLM